MRDAFISSSTQMFVRNESASRRCLLKTILFRILLQLQFGELEAIVCVCHCVCVRSAGHNMSLGLIGT